MNESSVAVHSLSQPEKYDKQQSKDVGFRGVRAVLLLFCRRQPPIPVVSLAVPRERSRDQIQPIKRVGYACLLGRQHPAKLRRGRLPLRGRHYDLQPAEVSLEGNAFQVLRERP